VFRCTVQKSRLNSNLGVKGQSLRSPGTKKTKKCGILFASRSLGRSPCSVFLVPGAIFRALLRRWENQRMLSSVDTVGPTVVTLQGLIVLTQWELAVVTGCLLTCSLLASECGIRWPV